MEFKEFVSETLIQIMDGIQLAQGHASKKGFVVVPLPVGVSDPRDRRIDVIDFDVAVTVTEGGAAKSTVGVFSGFLGAGVQAQIDSANTQVSRVKFSIPMYFKRQA